MSGLSKRQRRPLIRDLGKAKELPDGRLFATLLHTGTGVRGGVSVERTTVQILSFEDGKVPRTVVYADSTRAPRRAGSKA